MNKILYLTTFATGAIIGSFATWKYVKTKYEKIAQEEIDSVKETILGEKRKMKDNHDSNNEKREDESMKKYEVKSSIEDIETEHTDYGAYGSKDSTKYVTKAEREAAAKIGEKPYIISEEDFGDGSMNSIESLTYHSDGVLVDAFDEIVSDIEGLIGQEAKERLEDGDTSVYVRDNNLEIDYEIVREEIPYSDWESE